MNSTSWGQEPAPQQASELASVEADYRGPVIPLQSLVAPFLALAGVYAATPAAFTMPIEDLLALQHQGKVLEVEPSRPGRPARLARVVSGAQFVALLAGLPEVEEQLGPVVQARLDAETQSEAYQAALGRYRAAQQEAEAARLVLQERLVAAARPFDLAQFARVERLAVDAPDLQEAPPPESGTAWRPDFQVVSRPRMKAPDSAAWSLDRYETEWNREHIVLRRTEAGQWEIISDTVGYVESNDDDTLHARGDSPNRAWRNFLMIRGRQPSVSTPRQFRAAEVERAALGR